MSKRTPSDLPEKHIELTEEEVELKGWVEGLKTHFPTIPEYFIKSIARAYQLNPEKFDDIIENDIKLPTPEQNKPGTYNAVKVYENESDLPDMKDVEDDFAKQYVAAASK